MLTAAQIVQATAVPGISHTEGLCGEVLNDTEGLTSVILDSLGMGRSPDDRVNLGIDVMWRGATEPQHLDTIVEMAFRPLNTNGYYWVVIIQITSHHEVDLREGEGSRRRRALDGRHLIVTSTAGKSYAWLLPNEFALHNPLVRDMIFSGDREEEHRLIFAHLHALTSIFWRI